MTWAPDLGYVGASCTYSLELQLNGGDVDSSAFLTREQMRAVLEAAEDTIDVRAEWLAMGATELNQTVEMGPALDGLEVGAHVIDNHRVLPGGAHAMLYERVARALGKRFLTRLDEHPEDRDLPVWHPGFRGLPDPTLDKLITTRDLIPTGFQIGWAANAAKYVHAAMPTPNPAVMRLEGDDEKISAALHQAAAKTTTQLRRRDRRHPPRGR